MKTRKIINEQQFNEIKKYYKVKMQKISVNNKIVERIKQQTVKMQHILS